MQFLKRKIIMNNADLRLLTRPEHKFSITPFYWLHSHKSQPPSVGHGMSQFWLSDPSHPLTTAFEPSRSRHSPLPALTMVSPTRLQFCHSAPKHEYTSTRLLLFASAGRKFEVHLCYLGAVAVQGGSTVFYTGNGSILYVV